MRNVMTSLGIFCGAGILDKTRRKLVANDFSVELEQLRLFK